MSQPQRASSFARSKNIPAKKSLGQHWLVNETYLEGIVAAADLTPEETVLEVGPGQGALTRHLAARAGRVIAVELDNRLITPLRRQFADQAQVKIIHGDILTLEPAGLIGEEAGAETVNAASTAKSKAAKPKSYKVVANVPYYISSALLRHLLEAQLRPTLAILLLQQEVAERICATTGDLSLLAVSVQFYAAPRILHYVPASAFRPPPKVDSAVLRLDVFVQPAIPDLEPQRFFAVVAAGFGQKRKQLLNSLSAGLQMPKQQVETILRQAGIEPSRRAETLSLVEWGALVKLL
jgi:16S rRNA (adenine1518-N6/adenine1519-N6)-dimethyltransferase